MNPFLYVYGPCVCNKDIFFYYYYNELLNKERYIIDYAASVIMPNSHNTRTLLDIQYCTLMAMGANVYRVSLA